MFYLVVTFLHSLVGFISHVSSGMSILFSTGNSSHWMSNHETKLFNLLQRKLLQHCYSCESILYYQKIDFS